MAIEITTDEAAKIIGVTPHQVRWYHRNGLLSARRIGSHVLVFRLVEVQRFKRPAKSGRPRKVAAPAVKNLVY